MKPNGKSGCTVEVCDCMRGSQTENGVHLQLMQTTNPVLPAAMFTTFAKAACVDM